ncbi:BatD family protein [Niabella insulamsoli]|uniref:BatD family protein n=1 Tax=Niabella insulamsoli TaxID=3144874 RepID=UPI0031FC5776
MKQLLSFLFLFIVSSAAAQNEAYVSLEERLKSNVFLKVDASNTDCFVGEPIVVTYKLYSAMPSESNIVRKPAFAGFEIKDLMSGADGIASRETIDGIRFDVHTVLKLQLTPYKAGTLSLGPLIMQNRIRLVDGNGRKDPVLNGVEEGYALDNGYFNLSISSVPIPVIVTALPQNSQRAAKFEGLVGDFKMDVRLSEKVVAPGKAAALIITITGKGDFSKIKQPEISWPDGVEVFDTKTDEDQPGSNGGGGYKSFEIPFVANKAGSYTIPSIQFSFFDAVNYKYKTITNIPLEFSVIDESGAGGNDAASAAPTTDHQNIYLLAGLAVALLLFIIVFIFLRKKKKTDTPTKRNEAKTIGNKEVIVEKNLSVEEWLQPATTALHSDGNTFSIALKKSVIAFLEHKSGVQAGQFNQHQSNPSMATAGLSVQKQEEVKILLSDIDMSIYSGGLPDLTARRSLLQRASDLLKKL